MTDDVLSVPTPYGDVASLAQGYMNRADGERLLLPLSVPVAEGQGVRFVVMLNDGTPAFAGAGRAGQVSDQGEAVPPETRYETLIDTLQFDERSQPVYDYIVAVRTAAYASPAEGDAEAEAHGGEEAVAVDVGDGAAPGYPEGGYQEGGFDEEPTAFVGAPQAEPESYAAEGEVYEPPVEEATVAYPEGADAYAASRATYDAEEATVAFPEGADAYAAQYAGQGEPVQSIPPEAIPTGMLTRPALGVHWAPAVPRRPTPRPSSGLFQYNGSGLPVPAGPPRPQLDPAYWVARAPHPSDQSAAAQAAQPEAYAQPAFEEGEGQPQVGEEPSAEAPAYAQEALDGAYAEDGAEDAAEVAVEADDALAASEGSFASADDGFGAGEDAVADVEVDAFDAGEPQDAGEAGLAAAGAEPAFASDAEDASADAGEPERGDVDGADASLEPVAVDADDAVVVDDGVDEDDPGDDAELQIDDGEDDVEIDAADAAPDDDDEDDR